MVFLLTFMMYFLADNCSKLFLNARNSITFVLPVFLLPFSIAFFANNVSAQIQSSFSTSITYPTSDGFTLTKQLYGYKICDTVGNLHDISELTYDGKFLFNCGNWNSTGLPEIFTIWKIEYKNDKGRILNLKNSNITNAYPFNNGLALVQKNDRYNFINTSGEIISTIWFNYVEDFSCKRALVAIGKWDNNSIAGRFGYLNENGTFSIPLVFECAETFSQNLARVWMNGKVVLIDTSGRIAKPGQQSILEAGINIINKTMLRFNRPENEDALLFPFIENVDNQLVPFTENTKWYFQNIRKQTVISEGFDFAEKFTEGVASVKLNKKWYIIDKQGNKLNSEGFDYTSKSRHGMVMIKNEGKVGFIERNGNFLLQLYFPVRLFFKNAACIEIQSPIHKTFQIITSTKQIIYDSILSITPINHGLFELEHTNGMKANIDSFAQIKTNWHYRVVFKGDEVELVENKGLYKYRNKDSLYTKIWLRDTEALPEGMVSIKKNGRWGFINRNGQTVIEFDYDDCRDFKNGHAVVRKNNTCFFIDKYGKAGTDKYQEIGEFNENRAPALLGKKWGFIDEAGKIAIKCHYDFVGKFSEGFSYVRKGKRFAYINKNGNKITPFEFIAAGNFLNGIAIVRKGKQNGYIDNKGTFFSK